MEKMEKSDGKSLNIVDENINKLKEIFPESFSEGGISFEILRHLLGDHIHEPKEKYGLNWHGKHDSLKMALTPTTGTLRPCPSDKESANWHRTQNLFFEGENMMVLKLLLRSYAGKIKLIYIDPPYNTDADFVYSDSFQDDLGTYLKMTGQVDDNGHKISSKTEANGKKHTKWLNMMYPRLKLARTLLSEDGVLICHIDEHEYTNLNYLMDELFGPENELGPIIWDKKNPKGDAKGIATQHEYIVIYAKNADTLIESNQIIRSKPNAERILKKAASIFSKKGKKIVPDDLAEVVKKYDLPVDIEKYEVEFDSKAIGAEFCKWLSRQSISGGEAAYKFIDEEGQVYQSVAMTWPNKSQAPDEYYMPLKHPVTNKECPVPEKGWRNSPDTMKRLLEEEKIIFGEDENTQPRRKYVLSENMDENIPSILPFGGADDALLDELGIPFEHPKPVAFVKNLLSCFLSDGDMVLDFFAGSGTTAHATMLLCAEQNLNINFAVVQMPEPINPKIKKAMKFCENINKAPNVAEICKERIRQSAMKIKAEFKDFDGDLGFKVFKLNSSNIRAWNPDTSDMEKNLLDHELNLVEGRTELDVLYEIILKKGIKLGISVDEMKFGDKVVFSVNSGEFFVCLDDNIKSEDVEALAMSIIGWHRKLKPPVESTAIFLDSAFTCDVSRLNLSHLLEQEGIAHVQSI